MNTKGKGDITELKVLLKLLEHELNVSVPHGDNTRYDLVFEKNNKFYRVQCKTGRMRNGVVMFKCSTHHPRDYTKVSFYNDDVDYFGVYCFENDKVYLIPIEFIGRSEFSLRTRSTKNNQNEKIIWAMWFEI
jgi:hypothetical protein